MFSHSHMAYSVMKRTTLSVLRVRRSSIDHSRGFIEAGPLRIPCALGRSGTAHGKREGDGVSVIGRFSLIQVFYRRDKRLPLRTGLPLRPIRATDGWCDDPCDQRYNRKVTRPYPASHEAMWRDDGLYDVVVDIGINRAPTVKGRGSALFLHIARPGYTPTAGCVAVSRNHMARLLAWAGPNTILEICG